MNKISLNIWDREFTLDVIYQNYPGEEITDIQRQTVDKIPSVDFSLALEKVKEYIFKNNPDEVAQGITNIFKYVMPKRILVDRSSSSRVFGIICNYKFDMEHGMGILYENEQLKEVGSEDIIL